MPKRDREANEAAEADVGGTGELEIEGTSGWDNPKKRRLKPTATENLRLIGMFLAVI
jgi:hypothetical protein